MLTCYSIYLYLRKEAARQPHTQAHVKRSLHSNVAIVNCLGRTRVLVEASSPPSLHPQGDNRHLYLVNFSSKRITVTSAGPTEGVVPLMSHLP